MDNSLTSLTRGFSSIPNFSSLLDENLNTQTNKTFLQNSIAFTMAKTPCIYIDQNYCIHNGQKIKHSWPNTPLHLEWPTLLHSHWSKLSGILNGQNYCIHRLNCRSNGQNSNTFWMAKTWLHLQWPKLLHSQWPKLLHSQWQKILHSQT